MEPNNNILFSIIIPTRDRPELFAKALKSVIAQNYKNKEIIVIDDGSTETNKQQYIKTIAELNKGYIKLIHLIYRPNGHNSSFTRNYGVELATGKYICFLDDDDIWTDTEHLKNAHKSITYQSVSVELYLTNQTAIQQDGTSVNNVWINDLQEKILNLLEVDDTGTYTLSTQQLLLSNGFCHLNCTIYLRDFFISIKGLDENYRYEPDRDIYIRAIDQAKKILHNPTTIGKHYIPDQEKKINISTKLNKLNKFLYQLRTFDKGILFCKKKEIISYCKLNKSYILKKISTQLYEDKRFELSYNYAKEAFSINPTIKWLGFTLLILIKKTFYK